ncbi:hypothetical protein [Desulfobacula sp.]|uniref:hypothetical protein n=1 Tax=Desulfobacula sp. TaxID=2593537 RepID=UPI002622A390|nr:hypothetical protein [Desulfobacula sp.]
MKRTLDPTRNRPGCLLFSMFFIIMVPSMSFAQDLESDFNQTVIVSANVLTISARNHFQWMSISYNGRPGNNKYTVQSTASGGDGEERDQGGPLDKFGKTAKQMSLYLLRYFKVEDVSTEDPETAVLLKSKVNTVKINPNDFELNLFFNVGYDSSKSLKMDGLKIDGLKIETFWRNTFVNATYNYENKAVELGLSNARINDYFIDGMKLEFQTNSKAGLGALLLSMSF